VGQLVEALRFMLEVRVFDSR